MDLGLSQEDIAEFILDNNITDSELEEFATKFSEGYFEENSGYNHPPVDIKEFITSREFMSAKDVLYPKIMPEIEELNSGGYIEAVLTGAIGTGKTTIALYTTAYQLYLLSCMIDPHASFGLDPASEIIFIFQSINATLAKAVDYSRFKTMIHNSPYFKNHFPYNTQIESQLEFPNRIIVKPVSGADTAAIGQNVFGGVIDELNFMAMIEKSKNSVEGGSYDQASSIYNSIARRRKTRFMRKGKLPGILCLVSSKKYPGEFTDGKIDEAKLEIEHTGKTSIFVYDKKTWDVFPDEEFTGEWFHLFIGDLTRKPVIIEDESTIEEYEDNLIIKIPIEYKMDFVKDMMNAIRDIAGVSTLATMPFITNLNKLNEAFDEDLESIFTTDVCDFKTRSVGIRKSIIRMSNFTFPRFAHVDLGLTSDAAGITIGHVNKFVPIDMDGTKVVMPNVIIDGMLRVVPPANGEISFEKIRKLFYTLNRLGFPVKWVTFDSYQSVDSIQILRGKGFSTGNQSIDSTTLPYDVTKTAILENRLHMPSDEFVQMEFARLKRTDKGKIDHPMNGTKDIADSVAGVVYGLTMQRMVWAMFDAQPTCIMDLDTLYDLQEKSEEKMLRSA